jgi:hypothetical protein
MRVSFLEGEDTETCEDKAKMLEALKNTVNTRNAMGGQMYWNMLNDEACAIASRLLRLGHPREELTSLLGEGNFR